MRAFHSLGILQLVAASALNPNASASPPPDPASAISSRTAGSVHAVVNACPRPGEGEQVTNPPALYSQNGVLTVAFSFQTRVDAAGRKLFCFTTPSGLENPTLHVLPGDTLYVTITNNTPQSLLKPMVLKRPCNEPFMYLSSVNLHYHGTNVSPHCGSDEVIQTVINSGNRFTYTLKFPADEPPGLYWYHPHVHGVADLAVTGGATGALVVDGIESFFPSLAGMPQQTLVLRDQLRLQRGPEGPGNCGIGVPFRDVSVNGVPVNSFQSSQRIVQFVPATLTAPPSQTQFWRVANTSADTIMDLSLVYDGVTQPLNVAAIDGVPVNSQAGVWQGGMMPVTHFRLPPASRVEFVATMPTTSVKLARLMTQNINTGQAGDCDPTRPLIVIKPQAARTLVGPAAVRAIPTGAGRRFAGLATARVTVGRILYFSEDGEHFYITPAGATPKLFEPNNPPSVITHKGAVEQWTIQNRSQENHEFHIHQIHFLVKSQDHFGKEPLAPAIVGQYLDTIDVPAWSGDPRDPFPSVTLLMDFRGDVRGRFVFHCHILNHEDQGMMGIIEVRPPEPPPPAARR